MRWRRSVTRGGRRPTAPRARGLRCGPGWCGSPLSSTTKHGVSAEILGQVDGEAFLGAGRAAILDASRPLLADAQRAGEVRSELSLEQVLELVLAVAAIRGPVDYVEPILQTALDGLLGPTADRPDEGR